MLKDFVGENDVQARAKFEMAEVKAGPVTELPPVDGFRKVRSYAHQKESFTQGLWWSDEEKVMYEGGGGPNFSHGTRISRYNLETAEILKSRQLPQRHFGEGVVGFGDKLIQLTWRSNLGFVYDRESFKLLDQFTYDHEGWGITTDGKELIMSDGSATLHFLDPTTYKETRKLVVRYLGRKTGQMTPLRRLNDLQWIKGEIYANIWESDRLAVIDPSNGVVKRFIELKGLLDEKDSWIQKFNKSDRCLNGIAYDFDEDRLFVTGKMWTKIYEIGVVAGAGDEMEKKAKMAKTDYYAQPGSFDPLGLN